MSVEITIFATLTVGIMYASVFEWVFHKYVMHRPLGKFRYPFKAHTLTHHRLFRADYSYHLQKGVERKKIRMAWWNGPVLIVLVTIPFAVMAMFLRGFVGFYETWAILGTGLCVATGYYTAYEYLHWCMHLPRNRRVERSRIFRRLNGHHVLHHRYMRTNYNVVLPFADLLFDTLLLRARNPFMQVRGSAVPDVQPR